jgi:hypothetical protein
MLAVIAILLVLVLVKPQNGIFVQSAEARYEQSSRVLDVNLIKTVPADGLREIITLGDGKTFLLQQKDRVSVYNVDYRVK